MSDDAYLSLALIVRPQGRHGEVIAELLTDFPERFESRRELTLLSDAHGIPPRSLRLEGFRLHSGRVVLKFAEVDSISAAEVLRNLTVSVPASERVSLDADTYYIGDLIGCRLLDEAGGRAMEVGEITAVYREPVTADILAVTDADGTEHLIPFARAYLRSVDLKLNTVRMALPEGLLTLHRPALSDKAPEQRQADDPPDAL